MTGAPRCYTVAQVLDRLQLPRRTFYQLRRDGRLPMLEELQPRLGRLPRYRADLIDQYVANQWSAPRLLRRHA